MLNIKEMDGKSRVLALAIAFAFVVLIADQVMTGNVSKQYINKGSYFSASGESQCDKAGGMAYVVGGQGKELFGKRVKLHSISDDVSLVSVDGAKRAMEGNAEKYIAGLYVSVFSTGTNDACLVVRNWQ